MMSDDSPRKRSVTPSSTIESKLAPTSTATNRLSRLIPDSIVTTTGTLCVSLAQAKVTQPQRVGSDPYQSVNWRKPSPASGHADGAEVCAGQ
jgi:hypothetical protein